MDKDLILIVGAALIAAVVLHGAWLAYRNRAQEFPVRPLLGNEDDAEEAKGDYGDGILSQPRLAGAAPAQETLALQEAPMAADAELNAVPSAAAGAPRAAARPIAATEVPPSPGATAIVPDPPPRAGARAAARPGAGAKPAARRAESRPTPSSRRGNGKPRPATPAAEAEIFAINVLARNGGRFTGTELLDAFDRHGLKYRDRNIFHRLDAGTNEVRFSVANAVEPGYFDLADIETLRTPGVSFFFQLPGAAQPAATFDDMLSVARDIASTLGGDLKDEKLSVLTGQTISHFRERIAEFSRKQMSVRPPPHG